MLKVKYASVSLLKHNLREISCRTVRRLDQRDGLHHKTDYEI